MVPDRKKTTSKLNGIEVGCSIWTQAVPAAARTPTGVSLLRTRENTTRAAVIDSWVTWLEAK